MKAILVVDVEEYGDYYVDVYRKDADDRFEGRYYLKPLPQKKEETFAYWIARGCNDPESYINGWNACLGEITGETE